MCAGMLERLSRSVRLNKFKIAAVCIILVIGASAVFVINILALSDFNDHYFAIMRNLNNPETKSTIGTNLTQAYNFTQLLTWEHNFLEFVPFNQTFEERYTDPVKILHCGKGRCEEFSILYVSACLALGYEARIVVARRFCELADYGLHVWAEVNINGSWIHVDPSDSIWNQPSRYRTWGWGDIGFTVNIYAFEDGKIEEVSNSYK
jgi:hypothetical protein